MANVHPNADIAAGGGWTLVGAGTIFDALDSPTASYVAFLDSGYVVVSMDVPSGLTDDLEWVRGEVRVEAENRSPLYSSAVVSFSQQPGFSLTQHGGPTGSFADSPAPDGGNRFIEGPRSMFLTGQWRVNGFDYPNVNDLRFEIIDYVDPPTTSIVGPSGVVALQDIDGEQVVPVQWTFTSPHSFPYVGWRLQVCTNIDGTGVIYTGADGSPALAVGLTHNIPSWVFTHFIGTPLFVRVSVAHDANFGSSFIGPDPVTGTRQFGAFVQATFTPTGTITSTFGARRPAAWVDDLDEADRDRLTLSHTPELAAVLYQWDGTQSWPLDIISGSVTHDANNQIRATCSLTVTNYELRAESAYPIDPSRPLHPYGSYVQIARGVNGHLVALGAFVIDEVNSDVTVSGSSAVSITGSDWSRFLADSRLTYGTVRQTFAAGSYTPDLATTVMVDVVNEAGLTAVVNGSSAVSVALNYLNTRGDERPVILDDVCNSIDWWWYADSLGRIVFEPRPSSTATPTYVLVEGPTCTIVRHSVTLSRTDTYDLSVAYDDAGLFVAGAFDQNPDSPIRRGDGDPDTPTLGAGPFGPGGKPFFFSSPLIGSLATAEAIAETNLTRKAVPVERILLDTVPMPDLRPGHVITVQRAGQSVRTWVVEVVATPLSETERQAVVAYAPVTWIQAVAS